MKLQKRVMVISGIIVLVSLIISYVLDSYDKDYWCNIFVGLFSSSMLVLAVAVITYLSERKQNLYRLYCVCKDFVQVVPYGQKITSKEELPAIRVVMVQAQALYDKEMQFYLDDLSAMCRMTKISKIVKRIRVYLQEMNNALIDSQAQITRCLINKLSFAELAKNGLKVSDPSMADAAEKFVKAVNELVQYIKDKKIHSWEASGK